MGAVAERLTGLTLTFVARAGETGKLFGSVTTGDIAAAIERETGVRIDRRNIAHQPLREVGTHKVPLRLTVDLIPDITVIVNREGEQEGEPAPAPAPASPAPEPEAQGEAT